MITTLPSPKQTVAEQSASPEEQRQTPQGHVAPVVHHGQPVAYFPKAIATRNPAIGVVVQLGMRGAITIRLLGNRQIIDAVPHIGDPRLVGSVDRRENGAWDLTDYDKNRNAELKQLRADLVKACDVVRDLVVQVGNINGQLTGSPVGEPMAASSGTSGQPSEQQQLRAKARELGIAIVGNPGVERLKAMIADHMASAAAG